MRAFFACLCVCASHPRPSSLSLFPFLFLSFSFSLSVTATLVKQPNAVLSMTDRLPRGANKNAFRFHVLCSVQLPSALCALVEKATFSCFSSCSFSFHPVHFLSIPLILTMYSSTDSVWCDPMCRTA